MTQDDTQAGQRPQPGELWQWRKHCGITDKGVILVVPQCHETIAIVAMGYDFVDVLDLVSLKIAYVVTETLRSSARRIA